MFWFCVLFFSNHARNFHVSLDWRYFPFLFVISNDQPHNLYFEATNTYTRGAIEHRSLKLWENRCEVTDRLATHTVVTALCWTKGWFKTQYGTKIHEFHHLTLNGTQLPECSDIVFSIFGAWLQVIGTAESKITDKGNYSPFMSVHL